MSHKFTSGRNGLPWWGTLGAIVAAAALLRLCNLGTFSLALDEGLTLMRAVLPFPEMIASCAADADNVPLYLVITYCSLRLGLVEPWLRMVPIAAGVASIVVWSWWARRHFGSTASLLLAGFMALSTYHVRYSQELRAYPYLILLTGITMLAGDRLRRRPGALSAATLAVVVALGWYLHFLFALALVPLVGLVLFGAEPATAPEPGLRRKTTRWLVVALVVGTASFLPWFLHVRTTLTGHLSRGASNWGLELLGRRWQFLTVAAFERERLNWLGAALAVVAVVGVVCAVRHRVARAVLLSAVAAVLVSEALLVAVNRWSEGRYNASVWPLFAILIALGLERLSGVLRWRWLRTAVLAAFALVMLDRVDAYHRLGRPHWDRVATAVVVARRPGEPILADNDWSKVTLEYYLHDSVLSLRNSVSELRSVVAQSPSVLLAVQAHQVAHTLDRFARRGVVIAEVPQTGRLVRLRPDMLGTATARDGDRWPEPAAALVPEAIEEPLPGCLTRVFGLGGGGRPPARCWSRLELDGQSTPFLRSGWSNPGTARGGASLRLVRGLEAAVVAQRPAAEAARVSLRLSQLRGLEGQEMRLLVNGFDVGTRPLERGPQTVDFDASAQCWKKGRNLLVLQFREVVDPSDGRGQPRAAAVDWIEITPLAASGPTAADEPSPQPSQETALR